jgi:hypothetical protein
MRKRFWLGFSCGVFIGCTLRHSIASSVPTIYELENGFDPFSFDLACCLKYYLHACC